MFSDTVDNALKGMAISRLWYSTAGGRSSPSLLTLSDHDRLIATPSSRQALLAGMTSAAFAIALCATLLLTRLIVELYVCVYCLPSCA